jgi:hypothetical protein
MKAVRAAIWSLSIGVFSVLLAAILTRAIGFPLPMLVLSVAAVSAFATFIAELTPREGALGGASAAVLVAIVLGVTLAAAPIAPGAHRPELRDLLWQPLFGLIGAIAVCALAGWASVRGVLRWRQRQVR